MKGKVSRRRFLRTGALAVAGVVVAPAIPAAAAPTGGVGGRAEMVTGGWTKHAMNPLSSQAGWVVKPFELGQVTLGDGLFRQKRDRMLNYARNYPVDNMLYNFRANAGLPNPPGSSAPGGWDTPTGNLRGHFSGHYMTLLAQSCASTGESGFKDKIDYMVSVLGQCQDILPTRPNGEGGNNSPGFLAAYPESQFIRLERYVTYPTIWAPYYTNHMIMRGLLNCYLIAGNAQALEIVLKMGDWVHGRLSQCTREQLDRMWGIYIAGEFNAMNEVMAELYELTGDEKYLTTAQYFDNTTLLSACAANNDILNGRHANQHIPQFFGYARIFDQNDDPRYWAAATNFWDMVVPHRMYAQGGTSQGEYFRARDSIAGTIASGNHAETCCAYNMLKLSRRLFFRDPNPKYMDYYERALFNQILGSRRDADSTSNPYVTYFQPLNPGRARSFGNRGTCCGGTGLENHTKYQESIYFRSADDSALYVNLYIASTLNWADKGFTITQATNYPTEQASTLTIDGSGPLDIKLRVPFWVERGYFVKINGVDQEVNAVPGTYITLSRVWAPGDRIEISMPFSLRVEKCIDDPLTQSIFYGPILLVAASTSTSWQDFTLNGDLMESITPTGTPMQFTTNGLTLNPFYIGDTNRYHAYFKRVNRAPVFATGDQAVDENRTLTFVVEAPDPDGDPVTYSAGALPQGASFDAAAHQLTWTPDYTQAGVYAVHFDASDGRLSTGKDITITVNDVLVADQVEGLKASVAGLTIVDGIKVGLTAKLDQVLKLLKNPKENKKLEAIAVMNDFVGQVADLKDEGVLTEEQAAELTKAAEETIENITVTY